MADRAYVVVFEDGDRSRIRLAMPPLDPPTTGPAARTNPTTGLKEYHILAPSAMRAEQIARVMKGAAK